MKNILQISFLAFSLVFIASCSSDDPEPDPIIGTWVMDNATYTEAPSGYSMTEGQVENLYGENEYKIRFFDDMTYERDVTGDGGSFEDEGTWVQEEDDLTLTYETGTTGLLLDFTVEGDITDRNMDITASTSIRTFSDELLNDPETFDTLTTQESLNNIIETYSEVVNLKVTLSFDKE